jgi:outer membrane lipoprotein carrier protein
LSPEYLKTKQKLMKNLFLGTILALFSLAAHAQYDPKALEILDAMSKKYKAYTSFEANLAVNLINEVEKVNDQFAGKIVVKGDKFKLTLPEQEVINNGKTTWTYLPDAKEVNIDNFDPSSDDINPAKIYEIYKKNFKYLYLNEEMDGGEMCDVIDLVPEKKDAQFFKIKMKISKKDRNIKSWTMFDKSGNKFKYSISKFIPNIKVDDTVFSWDSKKYPGVEEIDLRN